MDGGRSGIRVGRIAVMAVGVVSFAPGAPMFRWAQEPKEQSQQIKGLSPIVDEEVRDTRT